MAFLLPVSPALAETPIAGPIAAQVLRVVDGDTLQVRAHIWPGQQVEVKVRLARVNAPEIFHPRCAQEKTLGNAAKRAVPLAGEMVQLRNVHWGKYAGRVIADVQTPDGTDVSNALLSLGLAAPQGSHHDWCNDQAPSGAGVLSLNRQ